ncbi:MAG TPA: phage tail protein [bacterium]|nr:phage tail protein [bacterium]
MQTFFTYITSAGLAKLTAAHQSGTPLALTHIAVGDGDGSYPSPTPADTVLVNEVYRAAITGNTVHPSRSNWQVLEMVIPANQGGWTIREVGVFDEDGDLFAVGKYPATYKPTTEEGGATELTVKPIIELAYTNAVTVVYDDSSFMTKTEADALYLTESQADVRYLPIPSGVDTVVSIPSDSTPVAVNALIAAQDKYIPEGRTLTFKFPATLSLDGSIVISGFYGGGQVILCPEAAYTQQFNTTKQAVINFTGFTAGKGGINVYGCAARVSVDSLKITGDLNCDGPLVKVHDNSVADVVSCYLTHAAASSSRCAIRFGYGSTGHISLNYIEFGQWGIVADLTCSVYSAGNEANGGYLPIYGLYSSASIIYKDGNQPTGSMANELTAIGGKIY